MAEPVAIVAAHPDDETIGCGGILPLFARLIVVHVTDGAPGNGADARAHGFASVPAYAAARRAELDAAFAWLELPPTFIDLDIPDQRASFHLDELTRRLRDVFVQHGVRQVLTHPYEGGHPDHDAVAVAVADAARARAPVYEFASYHAGPGGLRCGAFLDGAGRHPGCLITLSREERQRKRAMLACFASQRATLAPFGVEEERFRPAPDYDFARPPHDGVLHYERFDWGLDGARWRDLAAARTAC